MYSKERERQYNLNRKRNKVLYVRCSEAERELVYKVAEQENKTIIDLLLSLVNEKLQEE